MLVIMDRGFPGVALWRAYTGAGAHLLIRARSCVAARPIEYLPDGTYLARMNLAGQKRAAPGHVVLRVIEYQVDGGEVIRLLTDLLDPRAYPAGELAALYRERWEAESSYRQIKTFQRGPQQILRSADPRRPRVADRLLKRQNSQYSYRAKGQQLRPTRRAPARTITLHPAILQ
jgi:hypothetical protein